MKLKQFCTSVFAAIGIALCSISTSLNYDYYKVTAASASVPGDADGNGEVNASDLLQLKRYLLLNIDNIANCDMNGDRNVDQFDYMRLQSRIVNPGPEFDYYEIEEYNGSLPYCIVNNNVPYIQDTLYRDTFEHYSNLDEIGRCGLAYANLCTELMPNDTRGDISGIHPTGWHSVTYDNVEQGSLYNRSHLIAFKLAGENANDRNLITGTRYFNSVGMLMFEDQVYSYIKNTGNHVLYRVTPVFIGSELVARGVLMEAYSVEDSGKGLMFCVFCYNVQPDIAINYQTGDSKYTGSQSTVIPPVVIQPAVTSAPSQQQSVAQYYVDPVGARYILNTSKKKFHIPTCYSVRQMSEQNKQGYNGDREFLLDHGYSPCGNCKP